MSIQLLEKIAHNIDTLAAIHATQTPAAAFTFVPKTFHIDFPGHETNNHQISKEPRNGYTSDPPKQTYTEPSHEVTHNLPTIRHTTQNINHMVFRRTVSGLRVRRNLQSISSIVEH
jgi:hypothetical protein